MIDWVYRQQLSIITLVPQTLPQFGANIQYLNSGLYTDCWLKSYGVKLQMTALHCLGSLEHILAFYFNVSGETASQLRQMWLAGLLNLSAISFSISAPKNIKTARQMQQYMNYGKLSHPELKCMFCGAGIHKFNRCKHVKVHSNVSHAIIPVAKGIYPKRLQGLKVLT